MSRKYQVGDRVVYCVSKRSTSPGPRAKSIVPSTQGDTYSYTVDKFWMVASVENGDVMLVTRTGKEHRIPADHHCLRHASWWEKLFCKSRFPQHAAKATKPGAT